MCCPPWYLLPAHPTDICAFGPRNYAAEAAACKPTAAAPAVPSKQPAPAGAEQQHSNAGSRSSSRSARSGWYCRDDRNSWRPVVELQQQLDYQQTACSSASSSARQHKRIPLLRHRRTMLQVARGSGGCRDCSGQGSSSCIVDAHEEAGYSSEPDLPAGDRGISSPCNQRSRQQQFYHHSPLVRR